ncbi:MAG TPA: hypothetical protein VE870_07295 [Bacteroidales bacterium]|nr:hypothetical protein [Bacteroidales bacterium]
MSFSKLASITLYIVLGISVVVIVFFYFGDKLVNEQAYQAKVTQLENQSNVQSGFDFQQDMGTDTVGQAADTTAAGEAAMADTTKADTAAAAPVVEQIAPPAPTPEPVDFTFFESLVYNKTDIALGWAYILFVLTAFISIVFPIIHMFSNPATMVRTLIILVVVAVVIGGAYMLGSDTPLKIPGYQGTDNSDPQTLKLVDMGLLTTFFILGLTLLSILYSEIAKYFK